MNHPCYFTVTIIWHFVPVFTLVTVNQIVFSLLSLELSLETTRWWSTMMTLLQDYNTSSSRPPPTLFLLFLGIHAIAWNPLNDSFSMSHCLSLLKSRMISESDFLRESSVMKRWVALKMKNVIDGHATYTRIQYHLHKPYESWVWIQGDRNR